MALSKEEKIDILDTAKYLHDSLKTYLKGDSVSDALLLNYALKASQISQTLLQELNSRNINKEQVGWQYDLLRKSQEKYPNLD